VLYQIFSNDFSKIRNLPKIFLRSFQNMAPRLRITDYRLSENEAFSLVKWNGPVIILVLVNRSTFGEDMREKRFSHFCSQ